MSPAIESIYGLEPSTAESLRAAGCETTRDLLGAGASVLDRRVLAVSTGQPETKILLWAQIAELFEIPGLDEFGVALLCEAGISSVRALAAAEGLDLEERFEKLHCLGGLFATLPELSTLESWIRAAAKVSSRIAV